MHNVYKIKPDSSGLVPTIHVFFRYRLRSCIAADALPQCRLGKGDRASVAEDDSSIAMRSSEDVELFLADKPREWAEILAARAALRVFPLLGASSRSEPRLQPELTSPDIDLTILRSAALLWLAALVPSHSSGLRKAAAKAATAATDDETDFRAAFARGDASSDVASFAADAAAAAGAYEALALDAACLASHGQVYGLRSVPLWSAGALPVHVGAGWGGLTTVLRQADGAVDWSLVWIDWYEAIRDGRASWGLPRETGEQILVEAMLWPQEEWNKGALHINRRIAELIEAARAKQSPPPEPDPGPGPVLAVTPRGFETVATPPSVSERTDPMQISLHQAVLRRIRRLDPEIVRVLNTHRLLHAEYVDYASFVSNDLADVDVPTIWSTGGALVEVIGKMEERYDRARAGGRHADLEELPDEAILANLTQLARDHAAFVMGFAQGRDLAARAATLRQLSGNPEEQSRRAKAVLAPMLSAAGLLAERASRMIGMIDRALDVPDEKTHMILGAATAVATRSVVSFGRAVAPLLPPALAVGAVVGSPLDVGMKLSGDPNWESLRAAMLYLRDNADALASFASHDHVMRRWLEWLIDQIKLHGSSIDEDADGNGSRR